MQTSQLDKEASCSTNINHCKMPGSSGFTSVSLASRMAFYESFH